MMRKITFAVDEYYHLYNRGTEKRSIFLSPADYKRFILLLHTCNAESSIHLSNYPEHLRDDLFTQNFSPRLVSIGCYCLMPNHFHLVVREKQENGLSTFMQKLLTAYSMYFNIKHDRKGRLFEGTFRSSHLDSDEYLRYMFAYVHLNPIKIKDPDGWAGKRILNPDLARNFLDKFNYSSYKDFQNNDRKEKIIISRRDFPDYFSKTAIFNDYINDWISLSAEKN